REGSTTRISKPCSNCSQSCTASLREIETHSQSGHLAEDLYLVRVGVDFGKAHGSWVRLQHELRTIEHTPAAGKSIAMLEEINGALEFRRPAGIDHLASAFIDEHQRAGLNERVHKPIVRSNEGVAITFQVESVEEGQGEPSPTLNQAAQKGCAADIDAGIEGQWERNVARVHRAEANGMGATDLHRGGVGGELADLNAEPLQHFEQIQPVNRTQ